MKAYKARIVVELLETDESGRVNVIDSAVVVTVDSDRQYSDRDAKDVAAVVRCMVGVEGAGVTL